MEPDSPETMQIETDEIYVGLDRRGAHYVFPIQAKGGNDKIAIQQIEQDILPRGAVKIAHLWAVENRTPVGGHFKIAHLR